MPKITYKRQQFLYDFICQLPDCVSATEIQKLIFLYVMKENLDFYQFIPYKFGPYSFQLAEDIETLCRNGYFIISDSHISSIGESSKGVLYFAASERGSNLIRKAYREYPYFSINSEIINRLFTPEEARKYRYEKEKYRRVEQILFTIGYEGKSVEEFINILIQNDIHVLCDVRRNPLSRKFGFSKNKLEHITKNVGIKYIHIPEIGIESSKRDSLDTIEDYNRLFMEYAKTLPSLQTYLEQLYSILLSENRVALMCFEHAPEMCHRHIIRDYLTNRYCVRSIDL